MIDKIITAISLVQAALTTLRAGSRALYMFRTGGIGVMDGPLIQPSRQPEESAFLWELSYAFRHAVLLEARPDMYDTQFMETALSDSVGEGSSTGGEYHLSLYGQSLKHVESVRLDRWTEEVLLEEEEDQTGTNQPPYHSKNSPPRDVSALPLTQKRISSQPSFASSDGNEDFAASSISYAAKVNISEGLGQPKTVTIRSFAPETFRELRSFFGVTEPAYLSSILGSGPFVSFASNSKGAARVGGFFFFTRDGTYLIKTIKHDEVGAFLKMLMRYHGFMKANGRRSLLTRFCGMYEIDIPISETKSRRETLVVMNSVFPVGTNRFITERFDLKGSTMGRECSAKEKASKGPAAVLKDLDLVKEVDLLKSLRSNRGPPKSRVGLHIGSWAKMKLMTQLRRDVGLLKDCKMIDYSLLVGVMPRHPKTPSIYDLVVASFSDGIEQRAIHENDVGATVKILIPFKMMFAPIAVVAKGVAVSTKNMFARRLPYFGAQLCGVDTGACAHVDGKRLGRKAMYYFGLIDFLQPFNWKKELEWKWKRLRYGEGFSCVPPDEYADRFLQFMDAYIT
jgi:1-phosphatidylinositol-4-phosphate 5-kinase